MTTTPREPPDTKASYLPALRWRALTPLFDSVVRTTTRERTFKRRLLDQANISGGDHVLDVGCGTGTLAISLKQRCPEAEVTGLDADPDVLSRARRKALDAGCAIEFIEGFSTRLPFKDYHFDAVLTTLFFHHLTTDDKRRTLAELARVLKPGGELHVADYARPSDPLMAAMFLAVRAFDGFDVTAVNARGELPQLINSAGLDCCVDHAQIRTVFGTLAFYRCRYAPEHGAHAGSLPRQPPRGRRASESDPDRE